MAQTARRWRLGDLAKTYFCRQCCIWIVNFNLPCQLENNFEFFCEYYAMFGTAVPLGSTHVDRLSSNAVCNMCSYSIIKSSNVDFPFRRC